MKEYIPMDSLYERQFCFNCSLHECHQSTKSGCLLKDSDSKKRYDLYLFIKKSPRTIIEIHNKFEFDDNFINDNLILLNNFGLVDTNNGKWFAN